MLAWLFSSSSRSASSITAVVPDVAAQDPLDWEFLPGDNDNNNDGEVRDSAPKADTTPRVVSPSADDDISSSGLTQTASSRPVVKPPLGRKARRRFMRSQALEMALHDNTLSESHENVDSIDESESVVSSAAISIASTVSPKQSQPPPDASTLNFPPLSRNALSSAINPTWHNSKSTRAEEPASSSSTTLKTSPATRKNWKSSHHNLSAFS